MLCVDGINNHSQSSISTSDVKTKIKDNLEKLIHIVSYCRRLSSSYKLSGTSNVIDKLSPWLDALLYKEMERLKYDQNLASDIVTSAAIGGIVGSKIYYLIENIDRVIVDPYGMIFSGAGLVFLGGLMGGTIGVTIVLRKNKLPWLKFADIIAPLLMIGYSVGRIGCFLVGDDFLQLPLVPLTVPGTRS